VDEQGQGIFIEENLTQYLLAAAGLITGFVDSIAGGGGLISVPVLSLALGPGVLAIGTNKIVGVTSTAVALYVYRSRGHVKLRGNFTFAFTVGIGAVLGSYSAGFVSDEFYKWLIAAIAPVIVYIIFRKEIWVKRSLREAHSHSHRLTLYAAGIACGFYDGIAGPGGGTLMFLALFTLARLPLLTSMATAKIGNLMSASVALVIFSLKDQVIWRPGFLMSAGVVFGAIAGATFATKNAAPLARVALAVVSTLLIIRMFV
jgi:hypothetical protein